MIDYVNLPSLTLRASIKDTFVKKHYLFFIFILSSSICFFFFSFFFFFFEKPLCNYIGDDKDQYATIKQTILAYKQIKKNYTLVRHY